MPPVKEDPHIRAFAEKERQALPFSAVVAPAEFDVEGNVASETMRFPIHDEMAEILEAAGLFDAARAVDANHEGEVRIPSGADILLKLRIHKLSVKFEGRNKWFWPNLLLWASFVFPAWWVPDETFSGTVDMELVAVSTRSGLPLGSHTASVQVRRDLDDFQRGWIPLGTVLAPAFFTPGNWRRVTREVLRPAVRLVQLDLARWIDGAFRERVESGKTDALSATSFALCVGLSKYESLHLHNLAGPSKEANALTRYLTDPHLGGLAPQRVLTLVDGQATRDAVLEALEWTLVKAPRAPDTVLVYLSGTGTIARGEGSPVHAFLTYDADPRAAAPPGVPLKTLAARIAQSGAGRVILVLDTGFAGEAKARAAGRPPLEEKILHGLLDSMIVRGRGFTILVERTGATAGDGFLDAFTKALAGAGDTDGDGRVTGAELKDLFAKTPRDAGYSARFFGEDLDKVILPFGRGRTKR
jgi:hypothetical protein